MSELYEVSPTNTFSSINFDVLKLDGIEDPMINTDKLTMIDFEESYFVSAVRFINECRNEYTEYKEKLYSNISEATNNTVVLESFSDFFVKVKEIIDKVLKFFKSLFDRFLTTLNKMINSESYLKKHKKDFDNFKSADEFNIEGYNYTFSDYIPAPQAILSFNYELFSDLFGNLNNGLSVNNVKDAINSIDLEERYNEFRAKVIGKDGEKIYVTDYPNELFRVFRDNYETTSKIDVDFSHVRIAVDRFFSFDKTKSYINNQYKQIERAYRTLQSQVEDITKRNGDLNAKAFIDRLPEGNNITSVNGSMQLDGLVMSGELMSQIDIYTKKKLDEIQECSNIHIMAFAAKLDAVKECCKQDKAVLYTALSRIQRTDSKRREQ